MDGVSPGNQRRRVGIAVSSCVSLPLCISQSGKSARIMHAEADGLTMGCSPYI